MAGDPVIPPLFLNTLLYHQPLLLGVLQKSALPPTTVQYIMDKNYQQRLYEEDGGGGGCPGLSDRLETFPFPPTYYPPPPNLHVHHFDTATAGKPIQCPSVIDYN